MLSGCLQRAVCSDPLSSDIREKSDGPTTSAGSAFRNFVLDRASYDETHGTEHTDADKPLAAAQQFVEQIPTNKSRVGTDPHELRNGIDRVLKIRETLRTGMSRLHYEFYVPNLNGKGEA